MQLKRCVSLMSMVLLSVPAIALSQSFRGTVSGTVTDPTGAAIIGAQVTLTELATNARLVTQTNGEGFYTIQYIPPGRYSLRIEAPGFQLVSLEKVEIRVGDRLTFDQRLKVGQINETFAVTGDLTPLLGKASASLGQVIDRRRLEDLPLPDGNPFTLARLAPGVAFTDVNNLRFTRPFDNGGTSNISINGVGSQDNEFTLDGIPNNAALGRQVAYVPPAEAVQKFKVVTSSFEAQQGHSAGAQIDAVLRSGKNRPFGSIYWFNRNEVLAANEFFVNANPNCERDEDGKCKRSPLRYNRYGATVGGPGIWSGKNRLFFFFAFEGLRQVTPATSDSFRINDGVAVDHVWTASPTLILNMRAGLTRFESIASRAAENSGQLRVERRFAAGYTVNLSYTYSKLIEEVALRTKINSDTVSTPGNPDREVFDTSGFLPPGVDIRLRNNIHEKAEETRRKRIRAGLCAGLDAAGVESSHPAERAEGGRATTCAPAESGR